MINRILDLLFGRKNLERTGNNDYFESSTYHISPGERARVAQLNNAVDAVEAALDKLPSETAMRANTSHYAVDTGSADAYAVALSYYSAVAYTDGMGITFKATNTNTGASTLNVNGLGAKLITRQDGSGLAAGDIPANKIVSVRYNSTSDNFEVHGAPAAGAGSMAAQNASAVTITGGSITGITDLAVADGGTGASTAAGARTNLGLGTIATQAANSVAITGGSISGITDLPVADGGTGASTASGALTNLGLNATAAEVNATCASNTATAAELSALHSQGISAADFTKLKAIADSQSYTTLTPGGDLTGASAIRITKINRTVTMTWSSMTHASAVSAVSAAGIIPAAYRPVTFFTSPVYFGLPNASLFVNTNGTLTFTYYDWAGAEQASTATNAGTLSWVSAN